MDTAKTRYLFIIITVLVLLFSGKIAVYAAPATTSDNKTPASSFEYKKYKSNELYKSALKFKMNSVYSGISADINYDGIMPIPGLISTITTNEGSIVASERFIPQGICSTGEYILVTAYDPKKKLKSVIYVIDKEQRKLLSTIVLPNKYHVGGIAFDGNNVWVPGNTSGSYRGKPYVHYIPYDDFRKMTKRNVYVMDEDDISPRIYIKNTPSYLEYDEGRLWVGTYIGGKETKESYAYGYEILSESDDTALNTTLYSIITGLDSSSQGMDIDGDYLYISSSYKGNVSAVKSSFITKYDIAPIMRGKGTLHIEGSELKRIEVPKMNEEILIDDGNICINFESASERWKSAVINTDRILTVNKDLWGTNNEE